MRVHYSQSLDGNTSRLAALESFLEFIHYILIKTVLGISISILEPDSRLVEKVNLEATVHWPT